nr:hypothetical protein [Tanacetum cinerariifolium]
MIIEVEIGGHFIHRMYVDGESASKILYEHCFNRLRPKIRNQMVLATAPLIGFSGEIIWPLGQLSLLVKIGDEEHSTSAWMKFVVVRSSSPYNGIIGRLEVKKIQAVPSTAHGMIKFLVAWGVLTLRSSKTISIECAAVSRPAGQPPDAHQAIEERIKLANMTGIPRHIADHRLNIREGCPLVRQKRRSQAADKNHAIHEEAEKLVNSEVGAAFKQMKQLIAELPTLTAPKEKEELIVYLAAAKEAVSTILMTEREAKQMPIYFVSPRFKRSGSELHINGKTGFSAVERPKEDDPDTTMDVEEELPKPWTFFTDRFEATNNEAEYEALIAGLRIAEEMGVKNLQANVDSKLVANQVNGTYKAKEADMIRYLEKVRTLTSGFRTFSIKQVPRNENKKADALSKIASTRFVHLSKQVLVEELKEKSINELEVLAIVEEKGNTWMTSIYEYLTEETLPAEVNKSRAVQRKSQRFAVINGVLYKKSFLRPWLRHEVRSSKSLANRILFAYYEQGCKGTDKGMSRLLGPCKVKFLIVAIDYFTKWIEAKPVATITGNQVKKFIRDNIVCKFGLPGEIITDNRKQFRDNPFKDWCEKLCIRQRVASVKHLQANGLVERENRSLGEGIKARLEARKRKEQAAIREAKSKAKMEKYYNSNVRITRFKPGDLVYRRNDASHTKEVGKLGPKWEGPYEITKALGNGAYKLRDRDGK